LSCSAGAAKRLRRQLARRKDCVADPIDPSRVARVPMGMSARCLLGQVA